MNDTNISYSSLSGSTTMASAQSQDVAAYIAFDTSFNTVILIARPIHGFLGVIGSLLLLVTLIRNKEFSEPCFICYKALAVAGIFYALCEILNPISRIIPQFNLAGSRFFSTNYTISWIRSVLTNAIFGLTEQISIYLVTFLSCQRAVACLLPSKFYLVNTSKICTVVTAAVTVIMIGYCIPPLVYVDVIMTKNGYARWVPSTGGYVIYENMRDSISAVQVPLVLISSALAIAGVLRVILHKRKLLRMIDSSPPVPPSAVPTPSNTVNLTSTATARNRDELKSTKRNLQLCYLQLSQAIPFAAYCAIVSQANWYFRAAQFSYREDGTIDLAYSYNSTWIRQLDLILESLANDYHFYLILIFSQRFRKEFKKRMLEIFKKFCYGL